MKSLQEIKDIYAVEIGYPQWITFCAVYWGNPVKIHSAMDDVCKRYAEQAIDECGRIAEDEMGNRISDSGPVYHVKTKLR